MDLEDRDVELTSLNSDPLELRRVAYNGVTLRATPALTGALVATLDRDEPVNVVSDDLSRGIAHVRTESGAEGWLRLIELQTPSRTPRPKESPVENPARLIPDTVQRQSPGRAHVAPPQSSGFATPRWASGGDADRPMLLTPRLLLSSLAIVSLIAYWLPWFTLLGFIPASGADVGGLFWALPALSGVALWLALSDAEDNATVIRALGAVGAVVSLGTLVLYVAENDSGVSVEYGLLIEGLSYLGLAVAAHRAHSPAS